MSLERVKHLGPDAHKSAVPTHGEPARPAARMDGENGSEKAPFVPTIKMREGSEVLALKKRPSPFLGRPSPLSRSPLPEGVMKIVKGLYWMETLILHLLTMERDFTPYHFATLIPDHFGPHKGSSRVKGPIE